MAKTKNTKVTNAKNKGREFCKRLRVKFLEAFPELDEEDIRIAVGYEQGCDLKLSNKAQAVIGLYIEGKNQKQISLGPWLEQTLKNSGNNGGPALIFHKQVSNKHNWICVPLEHYLEVRSQLREYEKALDCSE